MWQNYLKIAWRNLVRNKTFSTINVLGLALGMASSLLIGLWIADELSIGKQYPNADQLYRVMSHEIADGRIATSEDTPGLLADELKKKFPEVVYAAGFSWIEQHVLAVGDNRTRQIGHYAGRDWFSMYGVPLLVGTPASALSSPDGIAISRKLAGIYFGTPQRALGKTIRFDNWADYRVTAVFEDLPTNTSWRYNFLLPWEVFLKREPWLSDWSNSGPGTRLQLRPDADPKKLNVRLRTFLKSYNKDIDEGFDVQLFLQPETEAYLYSRFENGQRAGGRIGYVRLFVIVAVFLLVIAGINFTNLATARSVKRAREVGVRKVVGAGRSSLIGQFMGEALLLTALALLVALGLVSLLLPFFNRLTEKQLSLPLERPAGWAILGGLLVLMSGLAGSYPALFLSSLRPVRVLKGTLRFGAGAQLFRRGLVVFQFALSILMIVGTLVIYRQLQYVQTKNLGYDRQNLIEISSNNSVLGSKYGTLKEELLRMPGIAAVTYSQTSAIENTNTMDGVNWTGKDPTVDVQFNITSVGYDFTKTMGIRLVQGRDFSPAFGTDSTNYLVNQAAAERMGLRDPVGQPLTVWKKPGTIVGLLEDFHFNSLHVPIRPLIVRLRSKDHYGRIVVRTQPGQTQQALASLEALCRKLDPATPFACEFVDAEYEHLYKSETIAGTLATGFAILAIFIACLGLFGLAAFSAEQRTKEIGVRKVLGASVGSIVTLLSKDFLKLVLVAIVVASPVAWWALREWLQNFAYKTDINWWVFALAGGVAVLIALLTIGFQSVKAALMDPAKSLRNE
jgi:predicted permease